MVPHLTTALSGPINELEQRMLDATPIIERWFRLEWMEHTPPIYCAVDVRNAGFKLAPVAADPFPGGWQHLADSMMPLAAQAAQAAIEKICPEARNLLIVPENGEPSADYLAGLERLRDIFRMAGLNVRYGSIDPAIASAASYAAADGELITFEAAQRSTHRLELERFNPCTILLNNRLNAGAPGILEELHEQYLLPPLQAGGSVRRKSVFHQCYDEVCKRFGKLIGIDAWLLNPLTASTGPIELHTPQGMDKLCASVDALLAKVRRKYKEYGIQEKPFAVVKADLGASAMQPITVRDARDLAALPAPKPASRPAKGRGKARAAGAPGPAAYIVQEGVLTQERLDSAAAEPVIYTIDRYVVGGFYRLNAERGSGEVLDTPAASQRPLALSGGNHLPRPGMKPGASAPNRFYMYGVAARLALVAVSYEMESTDPELLQEA